MLVCGLLGAVAFAVYTARMDWKLAAEEVSEQWALAWPSVQTDCSPKVLRAHGGAAIWWDGGTERPPRPPHPLPSRGGTPDGARELSNHKEKCTHQNPSLASPSCWKPEQKQRAQSNKAEPRQVPERVAPAEGRRVTNGATQAPQDYHVLRKGAGKASGDQEADPGELLLS